MLCPNRPKRQSYYYLNAGLAGAGGEDSTGSARQRALAAASQKARESGVRRAGVAHRARDHRRGSELPQVATAREELLHRNCRHVDRRMAVVGTGDDRVFGICPGCRRRFLRRNRSHPSARRVRPQMAMRSGAGHASESGHAGRASARRRRSCGCSRSTMAISIDGRGAAADVSPQERTAASLPSGATATRRGTAATSTDASFRPDPGSTKSSVCPAACTSSSVCARRPVSRRHPAM